MFKCSTTLPTFTFGVGTARIVIPGTYLNYGPVTTGSTTCFGGLQSSSGIGINILATLLSRPPSSFSTAARPPSSAGLRSPCRWMAAVVYVVWKQGRLTACACVRRWEAALRGWELGPDAFITASTGGLFSVRSTGDQAGTRF